MTTSEENEMPLFPRLPSGDLPKACALVESEKKEGSNNSKHVRVASTRVSPKKVNEAHPYLHLQSLTFHLLQMPLFVTSHNVATSDTAHERKEKKKGGFMLSPVATTAATGGAAASSPAAAGPSLPKMPAALRQLVVVVERLTSPATPQPHTSSGGDADVGMPNTSHVSSLPPPFSANTSVVATAALLELVHDMERQYIALLELAEKVYLPQRSSVHTSAPTNAAERDDEPNKQAERLTAELENTVAALQQGIRSKLAQSSRLLLLNSLRREVAERRQCVTKMEGVLSVARQHARL
jgi:hypothetical protein